MLKVKSRARGVAIQVLEQLPEDWMVFDRSEAGIRNTPLFYHKKCLVYVEGPDDEVFWAEVFPKSTRGKAVRFKQLGGDVQLDKRTQILLDNNAPDSEKRFVVAKLPVKSF